MVVKYRQGQIHDDLICENGSRIVEVTTIIRSHGNFLRITSMKFDLWREWVREGERSVGKRMHELTNSIILNVNSIGESQSNEISIRFWALQQYIEWCLFVCVLYYITSSQLQIDDWTCHISKMGTLTIRWDGKLFPSSSNSRCSCIRLDLNSRMVCHPVVSIVGCFVVRICFCLKQIKTDIPLHFLAINGKYPIIVSILTATLAKDFVLLNISV